MDKNDSISVLKTRKRLQIGLKTRFSKNTI